MASIDGLVASAQQIYSPSVLSGSYPKVLTHFRTSGPGDVRICNGIFNNKESRGRLKQARQVCRSHLEELANKKKRKVEAQRPNDIAKAGGFANLHGGGCLYGLCGIPRFRRAQSGPLH